MQWCIYYADRSTFSDLDGPWSDAPGDGVVCVWTREGDAVSCHSGGDYYRRLEDGTIAEADDLGAWLRARGKDEWTNTDVKCGLWISKRRLEEIMASARREWLGK